MIRRLPWAGARRRAAWIFSLLAALVACGCAARGPAALGEEEQREAFRRFESFVLRSRACQDLEADAIVTFRSWFRDGAIAGILQARRPASLKFVGTNPLGQPLVVLALHNASFRYLELPEKAAWEGLTTAAAFREKTPPGVAAGALVSWLTGWPDVLPEQPVAVGQDPAGALWLDYRRAADAMTERFLYDPSRDVLLARELVDAEGVPLFTARYAAHQGGECRPPGRVFLEPLSGGGSLEIVLKNATANTGIPADEFQVFVPPSFERVKVE